MTYITETLDQRGRKERSINLRAFAIDLSLALGTLCTDAVKLLDASDDDQHQAIMVGNDRLDLRALTYPKACVSVYLEAPDIKYGDWSTYDKEQRTERASINPDGRSINAIARDINKRVIVANKAALAARRAYAAAQVAARASIVEHINKLKADFPGLTIRHREGEQNATLYSSDPYMSGTISSDGSVSLDRMSLTNTQFRAVATLLAKKGA